LSAERVKAIRVPLGDQVGAVSFTFGSFVRFVWPEPSGFMT
jgi:hypothetical protein